MDDGVVDLVSLKFPGRNDWMPGHDRFRKSVLMQLAQDVSTGCSSYRLNLYEMMWDGLLKEVAFDTSYRQIVWALIVWKGRCVLHCVSTQAGKLGKFLWIYLPNVSTGIHPDSIIRAQYCLFFSSRSSTKHSLPFDAGETKIPRRVRHSDLRILDQQTLWLSFGLRC